ncbi:MAG: Holliday junction branch migration protein RuvA [Pseudomonadota bacterium]
MIAKLSGLVDSVGTDTAVIDVGGVGYLVFASSRTLGRLPRAGEAASLLIETHVREDHIHLYGFATPAERDWFRLLTTVQGVGARLALALLGALAPDELLQAVLAQDKAALTRANGVGSKLAARIVTELKDKAGGIALGNGMAAGLAAIAAEAEAPGPLAEAVSALVNLGYRRQEALSAVSGAARALGAKASTEALIRAGLKELSH